MHVLPREMFGMSTFGVAMTLLRWLPVRLVDKFLLLVANFTLGNTDQLGLPRPKTGPIELKNVTGKTPVLDVGALSQIRSGKIKVIALPNKPFLLIHIFGACVLTFAIPLANGLLGFQVMDGVKEITRNGVKFMDGQEKEFDSIILATGYKSNVPTWLKVNITC